MLTQSRFTIVDFSQSNPVLQDVHTDIHKPHLNQENDSCLGGGGTYETLDAVIMALLMMTMQFYIVLMELRN